MSTNASTPRRAGFVLSLIYMLVYFAEFFSMTFLELLLESLEPLAMPFYRHFLLMKLRPRLTIDQRVDAIATSVVFSSFIYILATFAESV